MTSKSIRKLLWIATGVVGFLLLLSTVFCFMATDRAEATPKNSQTPPPPTIESSHSLPLKILWQTKINQIRPDEPGGVEFTEERLKKSLHETIRRCQVINRNFAVATIGNEYFLLEPYNKALASRLKKVNSLANRPWKITIREGEAIVILIDPLKGVKFRCLEKEAWYSQTNFFHREKSKKNP